MALILYIVVVIVLVYSVPPFVRGWRHGWRQAAAERRAAEATEVSCTCSFQWMRAFLTPAPWCRAEVHPFILHFTHEQWQRIHGGRTIVAPRGTCIMVQRDAA